MRVFLVITLRSISQVSASMDCDLFSFKKNKEVKLHNKIPASIMIILAAGDELTMDDKFTIKGIRMKSILCL